MIVWVLDIYIYIYIYIFPGKVFLTRRKGALSTYTSNNFFISQHRDSYLDLFDAELNVLPIKMSFNFIK